MYKIGIVKMQIQGSGLRQLNHRYQFVVEWFMYVYLKGFTAVNRSVFRHDRQSRQEEWPYKPHGGLRRPARSGCTWPRRRRVLLNPWTPGRPRAWPPIHPPSGDSGGFDIYSPSAPIRAATSDMRGLQGEKGAPGTCQDSAVVALIELLGPISVGRHSASQSPRRLMRLIWYNSNAWIQIQGLYCINIYFFPPQIQARIMAHIRLNWYHK